MAKKASVPFNTPSIELNADVMTGFVQSLLAKKFDGASAIPSFHKEWWDLACSEDKFVAIAAPRG